MNRTTPIARQVKRDANPAGTMPCDGVTVSAGVDETNNRAKVKESCCLTLPIMYCDSAMIENLNPLRAPAGCESIIANLRDVVGGSTEGEREIMITQYADECPGVIRKFKTPNFTVIVEAQEEHDVDLSFDETGEVTEKIESGEFVVFCAAVRVLCRGNEVATEYLGNCIYESPRKFMDHIGIRHYSPNPGVIPAGGCGSYFSDMIRAACGEARKELAKLQTVRVRA